MGTYQLLRDHLGMVLFQSWIQPHDQPSRRQKPKRQCDCRPLSGRANMQMQWQKNTSVPAYCKFCGHQTTRYDQPEHPRSVACNVELPVKSYLVKSRTYICSAWLLIVSTASPRSFHSTNTSSGSTLTAMYKTALIDRLNKTVVKVTRKQTHTHTQEMIKWINRLK